MTSTTTSTSPKTLDLRGVTDEARNERVKNAVAQLAGYHVEYAPSKEAHFAGYPWRLIGPSGSTQGGQWMTKEGAWSHGIPDYPVSMDAVLPLLERHQWQSTRWNAGLPHRPLFYWVNVPMGAGDGGAEGEAETLPLAACYALLVHAGYTILL